MKRARSSSSGERRPSRAESVERRQRVAVAEPHRLLLGALARLDGAAPKPALDPVDARSGEARIGRAEETVQLTAPAARARQSRSSDSRARPSSVWSNRIVPLGSRRGTPREPSAVSSGA